MTFTQRRTSASRPSGKRGAVSEAVGVARDVGRSVSQVAVDEDRYGDPPGRAARRSDPRLAEEEDVDRGAVREVVVERQRAHADQGDTGRT
ncbi:MAG: hypothetical protein R3A52_11500 [Polyangiales bacterium]